MTTHFITAEIDLKQTPVELQQEIKSQLEKEGEPLRWAITQINKDKQTAIVEAVVTKN